MTSGSATSGAPGEVPSRSIDASALLGIPGDSEFVVAAYRELLGRQPDVDGFLNHRFLLRAGVDRGRLLEAIASSEEGRGRGVVLEKLPAAPARGMLPAFLFKAKLGLQQWWWQVAFKAGEGIEAQFLLNGPARYWDLTYHSVSTLIEKQGEFETVLHAWRRELESQSVRLEEAVRRFTEAARQSPLAAGAGVVPGVAALLDRVLNAGMVAVDTAAGGGAFCLAAARRVAPGGRVLAFEPASDLFALLRTQLQAAGLQEGDLVEIRQEDLTQGGETGCRLDAVLDPGSRVDVIRLPASGAEVVVDGMRGLLGANAGLGLLWPCPLPDGPRAAALTARLAGEGFRVSRICPLTGAIIAQSEASGGQPPLLWYSRGEERGGSESRQPA